MPSYQLHVPRTTTWNPAAPKGFLASLLGQLPADTGVSLMISATQTGITWAVDVPDTTSQQQLTGMVNSFYPGAAVRAFEKRTIDFPAHLRHIVLVTQDLDYEDFTPVERLKKPDPMLTVIHAMQGLVAGEFIEIELWASPAKLTGEDLEQLLTISVYDAGGRMQLQRGNIYLPNARSGAELTGQIAGWMVGSVIGQGRKWFANQKLKKERVLVHSEADTQRYKAKLTQPIAFTRLRLEMMTPDQGRLSKLNDVAAALTGVTSQDRLKLVVADQAITGTTFQTFDVYTQSVIKDYTHIYAGMPPERQQQAPSPGWVMTAAELATIWHLPHDQYTGPAIEWVSNLPGELLHAEPSQDATVVNLGTTERGDQVVTIPRTSLRYHNYITGRTGSGKSTLLHTLIDQDIASGQGVAVIDPHGQLVQDILANSIPDQRVDDVRLLRCGDARYPVPLNPFHVPEGVDELAVFETILWMFKSIYADTWSGVHMEKTLRNILELLISDSGATPLDLQEVVDNQNFRQRLLARATTAGMARQTRRYWANFDNFSPAERRNDTRPILGRLSAFLGNRLVEKMTCHPQGLDYRRLITDKKIVLVDLSGDGIKSEVGSLAALFLGNFYLWSLSLGFQDGGAPPRFYLYLDEAHKAISHALPEMFAESRKFGLALTLSNQYVGQLAPEPRDGVLKNVGTKISLACDPDEASTTGKIFAPDVTGEQLQNFGVGQAAVKTSAGDKPLPAFVIQGFAPIRREAGSYTVAAIEARSRQNLGLLTAAAVDDWLDKRYASDLFSKPPEATGLTDFDDAARTDGD